jgi:hypothetical protein
MFSQDVKLLGKILRCHAQQLGIRRQLGDAVVSQNKRAATKSVPDLLSRCTQSSDPT